MDIPDYFRKPHMEKLVYLLYKSDPQPVGPAFTRRVLDELIPALKQAGGWGFVFNVADLNEAVRDVSPSRLAGEWEHIAGALHFLSLIHISEPTRPY